jgi:hypothetical protein
MTRKNANTTDRTLATAKHKRSIRSDRTVGMPMRPSRSVAQCSLHCRALRSNRCSDTARTGPDGAAACHSSMLPLPSQIARTTDWASNSSHPVDVARGARTPPVVHAPSPMQKVELAGTLTQTGARWWRLRQSRRGVRREIDHRAGVSRVGGRTRALAECPRVAACARWTPQDFDSGALRCAVSF